MWKKSLFSSLMVLSLLVTAGFALEDEDPLVAYPDNYKLLLENEHVRVLDFRLRRGSSERFHAHPAHVAYILTGFKIRFTFPDGTTALRETEDGDVLYSDAVTHASENIGESDAHGILIEMKGDAAHGTESADWLTAVTFITGKPGREAELERELRALSAPTRSEPGNVTYDLYRSPDEPNEFLRFEVWRSPDALEKHKKTPHIQQSFQKRQEQGWITNITTWKRVPGDVPDGETPSRSDVSPFIRLDPRFDALVPADAELEVVADDFDWVEGPVWNPRSDSLLFSNIPDNAVLRWSENGGASVFLKPSGYTGAAPFTGREPGSNGLAFDPEGRLVLCEHGDRRIRRLETDGNRTTLVDRFEGKRLNSPNDVVFRSNGDMYFTDPPFGLPGSFDDPDKELDFQGVYRLSRDGQLTLLTKELRAPNGIAFSPDETKLYVSDSAAKLWKVFDVRPDGSIENGRVLLEVPEALRSLPGVPDGMKVDAEGNLFAAGPGGIYVIAPDGTLAGRIDLGAATGNCAFGEDGSTLFIASSATIYRVRLRTKGAGWE